jgi:hypothetical protein
VLRNICKPYEVGMKTHSCQLAWVLMTSKRKPRLRGLGEEPGIAANSRSDKKP